MTTWLRQHRDSLWFRGPWHLEAEVPEGAAKLGLFSGLCGAPIMVEDRGIDHLEDPPLDDRCPVCQGAFARGEG